jgi:hypothetical protein
MFQRLPCPASRMSMFPWKFVTRNLLAAAGNGPAGSSRSSRRTSLTGCAVRFPVSRTASFETAPALGTGRCHGPDQYT